MSIDWNWGIFLQQAPFGNTTYLGWIWSGFQVTIALSICAWIIAFLVGSFFGILRTVPNRFLSGLGTLYVELFRNVPLIVQFFTWYLVIPELLPEKIGMWFKAELDPNIQFFLSSMLCLGLFSGCGSDAYSKGLHHAELQVEGYGTITMELDADTAPITVSNFCKLAKDGFYDGLTFHRIIDGFMIQGGDPEGNGSGGADQNIKGEFSQNGVENNISHVRGTVSMARSNDYNSASSQFFIVQSDSTFLDGQYAGFGHVTSGMEIVDQICQDTPEEDSNGTVAWWNQPKITSIQILD